MGNKTHTNNKEEDVVCEHPQLNLAKKILVDNQQLLRCSLCLDRKDYNRWKDFLDFYEDQFKIFMPKDHMFSSTTLCGSAGTVEIYYPNYSHLLHAEIIYRLNHHGNFTQPELWYLLLTLITAKKEAMQAGQMLGDVRPKNIVLNQQGSIKVPTLHSWPNELNRYQKVLDNVACYLAPEQMKQVQNSLEGCNLSQASEMFSIGLTLLSSANLTDYESLYNFETFKFDYAAFDEAISQLVLNNSYSEVLRSTIMNLCSIQFKRRMTLSQLWGMLNSHKDAIWSKSNFLIYNAPEKLHQEVQVLRAIFSQKVANYPSSLPDRTVYGLGSEKQPSVFQKLVPSYLDENTSSAMQIFQ